MSDLYKTLVFCDDDTCIYNDGGIACLRTRIHLNFTETEQFENGKRVSFNACRDYEVIGNAGS